MFEKLAEEIRQDIYKTRFVYIQKLQSLSTEELRDLVHRCEENNLVTFLFTRRTAAEILKSAAVAILEARSESFPEFKK